MCLSIALGSLTCASDPPIVRERVLRHSVTERTVLVERTLGIYVRPPEKMKDCEPGQQAFCGGVPILMPHGWREDGTPLPENPPLKMVCKEGADGRYHFDESACDTPLVVAFDVDEPVHFTKPTAGASFNVGLDDHTEWVSPKTPWLALDVDGSGCIEGLNELFGPPDDGSGTNGFQKLARFDGNGDGRIDSSDAIFPKLILWADRDQNQRCIPSEVVGLAAAGVVALDLAYGPGPAAPFGSHEGERAAMWYRAAGEGSSAPLRPGRIIDVYLAPLTPRREGRRAALAGRVVASAPPPSR